MLAAIVATRQVPNVTAVIVGTSVVSGTVPGTGAVAAAITGTATITATFLVGNIVVNIFGTSSVSGSPTATGTITATIVGQAIVTASLVTPGPPGVVPLPFDIKTTAGIVMLSCLFAAKGAVRITTDPALNITLQLEQHALDVAYLQMLQQQAISSDAGIHTAIVSAETAIDHLNTSVQLIIPTPDTTLALFRIQEIVADSLAFMKILAAQS